MITRALGALAFCYNVWVILIFAYAKLDRIVTNNAKLYALQCGIERRLKGRMMVREKPGTIRESRVYEWYAEQIGKQPCELTYGERVCAMFNYTASEQHVKDWATKKQ